MGASARLPCMMDVKTHSRHRLADTVTKEQRLGGGPHVEVTARKIDAGMGSAPVPQGDTIVA
jgi:hypothetical protein